jgi:serine O-acetyltransferase
MLELTQSSRADLLRYVVRQLDHFFPDNAAGVQDAVDAHLDAALIRLERCINEVRMWKPGQFDALHSSQYTIFLYCLANSLWRSGGSTDSNMRVCTKLFLLNKALNGIDCFYEIELPEVFFIGHSVGIVLAKAT